MYYSLFPLSISSLKRIGDIQALLVYLLCLEFEPGMLKPFLHPRPGHVPKVPTNTVRPYCMASRLSSSFSDVGQGET